MIMVNVNAQGFREKAIKDAIRELRLNLKSPSTFILIDMYGYKIPTSKVSTTFIKEETETYKIPCGSMRHDVDSIDYLYTVDSIFVDSVVYTTYRSSMDSIEHIRTTYPPQYKVSFFYESQNSYGGMVKDFATYYVDNKGHVSGCRISYSKTLKIEKNPNACTGNNNIKKTYSYIYKAAKKKEVGTLHYSSYNTILPLEEYNTKDTTKTKKAKNRGTDDIYF